MVDFLAVSVEDLLEQIKQRKPRLKGQEINISSNYQPYPLPSFSFFLIFLSYILHPQIAYLLFLGAFWAYFLNFPTQGQFFLE